MFGACMKACIQTHISMQLGPDIPNMCQLWMGIPWLQVCARAFDYLTIIQHMHVFNRTKIGDCVF